MYVLSSLTSIRARLHAKRNAVSSTRTLQLPTYAISRSVHCGQGLVLCRALASEFYAFTKEWFTKSSSHWSWNVHRTEKKTWRNEIGRGPNSEEDRRNNIGRGPNNEEEMEEWNRGGRGPNSEEDPEEWNQPPGFSGRLEECGCLYQEVRL